MKFLFASFRYSVDIFLICFLRIKRAFCDLHNVSLSQFRRFHLGFYISSSQLVLEYNLGQKVGDKLIKLSKIGFSMVKTSKFGLLVDGWVLPIK